MKLRCLLIDDEPPALKLLVRYISQINGLEIVGQCRNAIEALDVLHKKQVDLIFLDIKMPSILGTEFLRTLSHPPKVIFVTAYREYAVDGFELDAVDYLVKPVSFERFFKAIMRVQRSLGHAAPTQSLLEPGASILQSSLASSGPVAPTSTFVYLKVDKDMKKVFVKDIEYIESWKDYVRIYLTGGKHLLIKQTISAFENLLPEHSFLRIHRSYIISLEKVNSYNANSVQLGTHQLPVSRMYKHAVMDRLHR